MDTKVDNTRDSNELEMEAYAYFNAFASYAIIEKTLEELDWTTRVSDFLAYLNRRGFEISPGRTA